MKILTILFVVGFLAVGQITAEPVKNDNVVNGLQFNCKSDKKVYEIGEDIKLTFIFRNNNSKDISFFTYLLEYKLLKGNIKFKGEQSIYEVFSRILIEARSIIKEDFITLKPNEEYKTVIPLNTSVPPNADWDYLNRSQRSMPKELPLGIYEIKASYENEIDSFRGYDFKNEMPIKIPVPNTWIGKITSNTITIEVVEKKGGIEGDICNSDDNCQNIDCSKYDTPIKEGYKASCINGKCKCICRGCI